MFAKSGKNKSGIANQYLESFSFPGAGCVADVTLSPSSSERSPSASGSVRSSGRTYRAPVVGNLVARSLSIFAFENVFVPKKLQSGSIQVNQGTPVCVRVGRCGSMPGGGGGREKHGRIRGRPAQDGSYPSFDTSFDGLCPAVDFIYYATTPQRGGNFPKFYIVKSL